MRIASLFLVTGSMFWAAGQDESRGLTAFTSIQGNSSSLGQITRFDGAVGYNFNRFFGLAVGVPVYFVRPSDSVVKSSGAQPVNGLGNVYLQLHLNLNNPLVNYVSTVTASAPTGDRDAGLSTGRGTVDWNNHFDRSFLRLTPFVNAGLANTVSDTQFFVRPFTSTGFVTHLEGGALYKVFGPLSAGASGYAIVPGGNQTVVSKLLPAGAAAVIGALPYRPFESRRRTTGPASIAQDNGFSTWAELRPIRYVNFVIGYTHSNYYDLNAVSYGVGVNLGSVIKHARKF